MSLKESVLNAIASPFFRHCEITQVTEVGASFRLLELRSEDFKKIQWAPGEKVQINTGDWKIRTYTPLSIDSARGTLQIMAFLHGPTPGSRWASRARVGDKCQLMGPRASLKNPDVARPLIVYGDETAIPMAATFQNARAGGAPNFFIFEVRDLENAGVAVRALKLDAASTFLHAEDPAAIPTGITDQLRDLLRAHADASVILAGSAHALQKIRTYLRDLNFPMGQVKTKAYWAQGREGLD